MMNTGAVSSKLIETPFGLYCLTGYPVLFHYIDFQTYKIQNPDIAFLPGVFSAAQKLDHKIITIWQDVWQNKQELVQARILAMIGKRERVHARQTHIARLDKAATTAFLDQNHLQGSTGAYYKFGLLFNNELVAAATFSKARTMYDGPVYYRSYELERFASKKGITVTGGLGKLINHFTQQLNAGHMMTYADADWGSGKGYRKLGFSFTGHSVPQQFIIDEAHNKRTYFDPAAHSAEEIKEKGLLLIANTGSLKYVLTPDLHQQ